MAADHETFPASVYAETVLAPLFEQSTAHFAGAMAEIDRAHLVMLAEAGILAREQAAAIMAALLAIEADTDPRALAYDGTVEDYFFHVEKALTRRLGIDLAGRLHTGRSRNDLGHATFRMVLKDRLEGLIQELHRTTAALLDKAACEKRTIVVAYTHGQPAQPTSFGHYLAAFVEVLLRHGERLDLAHEHLDRSPMGAAAITTSGFALDRRRIADLLGFGGVQENSYGCIAATDDVAAVYAGLKLLCVDLGRFAQDLAQWTAFETGYIIAPRGYVQISSIMPQKRNPVVVEHIRLLAGIAAGHADAIVDTFRNTPFTDINDSESETQVAGYQAFERADRALRLLGDFMGTVRIDERRTREVIERSCATITELADSLVRAERLSFRQAHEVASAVARAVIESSGTLVDLPFDTFAGIFERLTGRAPGIAVADLRRFTSPEHFVEVRDRPGGPSEPSLSRSLEGYREHLQALETRLASVVERRRAARAELDRLSRQLAA
jgi:argininosuccinate lyase